MAMKKIDPRLFGECYLMSLPVLRKDWDRPEEDKAWAFLQSPNCDIPTRKNPRRERAA